MTGDLNLNNNKIVNLQTNVNDKTSAVTVNLMQNKIDVVNKKIDETHITSSSQKDVFRYLMENDDESSSENNIQVLGIKDFSESPHQINKKAYQLKLLFQKSSPNQYQSRLGFNLFKLPVGYERGECNTASNNSFNFQLCNQNVRKYTKTVINFHRWGGAPPNFIYLDLHRKVQFPALMTNGHLIVFGVKETISNVDPSVYDTAFVI